MAGGFSLSSEGAVALLCYVPALLLGTWLLVERVRIEFKFKQAIRAVRQPVKHTMVWMGRLILLSYLLRLAWFLLRDPSLVGDKTELEGDCRVGLECTPSIIITSMNRVATFIQVAAFGLLIIYLARIEPFSKEAAEAMAVPMENDIAPPSSNRGWWDFCFIFGVAWLTITQVFILLISMFDANLTKAQSENIYNVFIVIIGLLFFAMFFAFAYQGCRVWAVLGEYHAHFNRWQDRTNASILHVTTGPGGEGMLASSFSGDAERLGQTLAPVAVTGLPLHRRFVAAHARGLDSHLPATRGRTSRPEARQTHSPSSAKMAHHAQLVKSIQARTLFGSAGPAPEVTGDSASGIPPPPFGGRLVNMQWRVLALTVLNTASFLLRAVLFLYRPTLGADITGESGAVLYPWFFYTVPEILCGIGSLILVTPYAFTTCGCGADASQPVSCSGAVKDVAASLGYLLREDLRATARCLCCCCPGLLASCSRSCWACYQSTGQACCGAPVLDATAVAEWRKLKRVVAEGVPARYFEMGPAAMATLAAMDEDARHGEALALPPGISRNLAATGSTQQGMSTPRQCLPEPMFTTQAASRTPQQSTAQQRPTPSPHSDMAAPLSLGQLQPVHNTIGWHRQPLHAVEVVVAHDTPLLVDDASSTSSGGTPSGVQSPGSVHV